MRHLHAACLALALLLLPGAAAAQQAEATQLVDLLTPPAQGRAQLDQQLAGIRQGAMIRAMLANNPRFQMEAAKNQPAFNASIARMGAMQADALGPIFTEMQAASRRAAIAAYARQFTADELRAIIAFYRSPAGAKLAASQGQISAAIARDVQTQYRDRMEAAQKNLAPRLEAEFRRLFPAEAGATK